MSLQTCCIRRQKTVPIRLTLLSLALCCRAQWKQNSTCAATIKLDQTWPSNITGHYLAMLDIDLEYMGSQALEPGDYNIVVSCPTYLRALDVRGWTVTHQDNGNIAGTITLTSPLQQLDRIPLSMTVEGTSPERFYPTEVDFNDVQCYEQQE